MNLSDADKQLLLRLARETIARWLAARTMPMLGEFDAESGPAVRASGAAFVTLTRRNDGSLRGCVGEVEAAQPLYASVMQHALHAAMRDPRFPPVIASELPALRLEISALTPLRRVASYEEIELGRHGIMLSMLRRHAVFLPQVAPEQGWDLSTTLDRLALKAGLPPRAWRQGADFQVFEAVVFGEE